MKKKQEAKRLAVTGLPLDIKLEHKEVSLFIDIMFVNKIPFLLVKSEGINHIFAHRLRSRSKQNIAKSLRFIKSKYQNRGFVISIVYADNEFDHDVIKSEIPGAIFDICAAGEHVPAIERCIRTVKDRCRCMCHSIPFKRYTKIMTIHLIISCVHWLNSFPSEGGISDTMSPLKILEGKDVPDLKTKRIAFGMYALVHTGTSNGMNTRRTPAIGLSESNQTGGHFFMSLHTGKRLHGNSWDELPFDENVVDIVELLALKQNQPTLDNNNVIFWL